jgi:hypothetical protein
MMPENYQTLGVFSTDGNKYYIASYGSGETFHTNIMSGPKNLGDKKQGIVYSSDETNAAYELFQTPNPIERFPLIVDTSILSS